MISKQLLRNPVTPKAYERDKAEAIGPNELEPRLYMARLLLYPEVRGPHGNWVKAVEGLVELIGNLPKGGIVSIRHVSEDGEPEDTVYIPRISGDGLLRGIAAPLPTSEGYLISALSDMERELQGIEKQMLVPVMRHLAVPEQQRLMLPARGE